MAKVVLEDIVKQFGNVTAVNHITLEIPDKQFTVLVGPSGCGKTTCLRLIAGLEEATAGNIYIGDRVVNDVAPKDRDIAMVFQNYALYPHMTVYDNMAFGLRLRKYSRPEIDRRVKEAAEMLGIQSLLTRKPKQLSGGQRQRVALGRAIVREPQVFLMDEPLSNLDAKLRVQTRAEIKKLHARLQTTTVYVTHDQVEAMTMGDSIVVMRDGLVQQNGKLVVDADVFRAEVPASGAAKLAGLVGKPIIFGIRPEDIHDRAFHQDSTGNGAVVPAMVDVHEPLGSDIILYLTAGKHSLVARVDARSQARMGQNTEVVVDTAKMRLFNAETHDAVL